MDEISERKKEMKKLNNIPRIVPLCPLVAVEFVRELAYVANFVANLSQKSMPLSPQTVKQIVRLPFG